MIITRPIAHAPLRPILDRIDPLHRDLVTALTNSGIPVASLKLENELHRAQGITFTFAGFPSENRRKQRGLERLCHLANRTDVLVPALDLADRFEDCLSLLNLPLEVIGVDVTPRTVRQIKAYFRTNLSHHKFAGQHLTAEPSQRNEDESALAALTPLLHRSRMAQAESLCERLFDHDIGFEGIGIDWTPTGLESKFYFLSRSHNQQDPWFASDRIAVFVETVLEAINLSGQISNALSLTHQFETLGLLPSFMALDLSEGPAELKIYYSAINATDRFPDHRPTSEVSLNALSAAYVTAGRPFNKEAAHALVGDCGPNGVMLNDFSVDFSSTGSQAKVYVRSGGDLGSGILPSDL